MSDSKSILKRTKKQAAQLAKDIAKQGTAEVLGRPSDIQGENAGVKKDQPSPIVEAMQQSDKNGGVTVSGLKNVEQIEKEMAELRKKRSQEEEKSQQPQVVEKPKISEPGKPILPSSPRRGAKLTRPEKQKTKIEARLGKN